MALTTLHLQIAGVVILAAIAVAAGWWVVRAAIGWHSGRALYWLDQPHTDEDVDDDDDGDAR